MAKHLGSKQTMHRSTQYTNTQSDLCIGQTSRLTIHNTQRDLGIVFDLCIGQTSRLTIGDLCIVFLRRGSQYTIHNAICVLSFCVYCLFVCIVFLCVLSKKTIHKGKLGGHIRSPNFLIQSDLKIDNKQYCLFIVYCVLLFIFYFEVALNEEVGRSNVPTQQ